MTGKGTIRMSYRRLPIYFLVDVSASMAGKPIQDVNDCILYLIDDLRNDPRALENAWISIIIFGDDAKQIVPLTPLDEFAMPKFEIGGKTNIGGALTMLCECADREVRGSVAGHHAGDIRPYVYILSDGKNDVGDFAKGIQNFKRHKWGHSALCVVGSGMAGAVSFKRIATELMIRLDGNSCLINLYNGWWIADDDGSIRCCSVPTKKRLITYLVVDASETMVGIPIEAVKLGIRQLAYEMQLMHNDDVELLIDVIAFNDEAMELSKPVRPEQFEFPVFEALGHAIIGKALEKLVECSTRDALTSSYQPIVVVLSADGRMTDGLDEGLRAFNQQSWGEVVVCAAGDGADIVTLKQIWKGKVVKMKDVSPKTFLNLFEFIAQTVKRIVGEVSKCDSCQENSIS